MINGKQRILQGVVYQSQGEELRVTELVRRYNGPMLSGWVIRDGFYNGSIQGSAGDCLRHSQSVIPWALSSFSLGKGRDGGQTACALMARRALALRLQGSKLLAWAYGRGEDEEGPIWRLCFYSAGFTKMLWPSLSAWVFSTSAAANTLFMPCDGTNSLWHEPYLLFLGAQQAFCVTL